MTSLQTTTPGNALVSADDLSQIHETYLQPLGDVPEEERALMLAQRFLLSLKSPNTRRAYARDLKDWFEFCGLLHIDPLGANRGALDGYTNHLATRPVKPAKASTISRRLSTLAGYYKYGLSEGIIEHSPLEHIKRPKVPTNSVTLGLDKTEARALLSAAEDHSPRARALVTLLLHDGLRISEALNADIEDLSTIRGHRTLSVIRKGGARQDIPLSAGTADALGAYIGDREEGPIFRTSTGRRYDQPSAFRLIRKLGAAAGIDSADKLGNHSLRHTFVTLAREAGVPLEDVQDAAGHADPRTTRRYDRGRHNLDRHPTYALAAFLAE